MKQFEQEVEINVANFLEDLKDGTRTPEGLQAVLERYDERLTDEQKVNSINYQAIVGALLTYTPR